MTNTDLHVIGEFGIFSEVCFILCILRFSIINLGEIVVVLALYQQCCSVTNPSYLRSNAYRDEDPIFFL